MTVLYESGRDCQNLVMTFLYLVVTFLYMQTCKTGMQVFSLRRHLQLDGDALRDLDSGPSARPGGNLGANGWFLQSIPTRMPPRRGVICGRLT